jgi:tRNA-dihydrouridine synthase
MINLKQLLSTEEFRERLIDTYPIKTQKQWIQILTHNIKDMTLLPMRLKEFEAKYPVRKNIYGVNINASCPDPSVIAAGDGAAIIKRTKRLINLIESFLEASEAHQYHINCKFRLGLNAQEMNYNKILDFLEEIRSIKDTRFSPPIIHFRHARQPSKGEPHWEFLKDMLSANVPIIINGGITSPINLEKIKTILPIEYQQKWSKLIIGIMIGQGVIQNPISFCHFRENSNKLLLNNILKSWKKEFMQNIELHTPDKRFIENFKKFYPDIFTSK